MEAITIEETLNAPIDRVWRAWTDPEQLCPWFALRANVVPNRGGPYELFWDIDHPERQSTLGCRVTFIQPQRWLGFTWRGPTIFDDVMNENAAPPPPPTHVAVSFEKIGQRTIARVSHTGWLEGERWAEAHAWHVRAWKAVFQNLAAFVEGRELPVDWSAQARQS
jgi:uncharacterized protein YndB with AHSA1/START domain